MIPRFRTHVQSSKEVLSAFQTIVNTLERYTNLTATLGNDPDPAHLKLLSSTAHLSKLQTSKY